MEVVVLHLTEIPELARDVYRSVRFGDAEPVKQAMEAGAYRKVATVSVPDGTGEIDALERAFERTNHIDSSWTENAGVTAEPGNHRSTSVGDLAQIGDKTFIVSGVGWEETIFPSVRRVA